MKINQGSYVGVAIDERLSSPFKQYSAVFALLYLFLFGSSVAYSQTLPANFVQQTVVNGLVEPVNIAQLPGSSGQMFVLEKLGRIRLFDPSDSIPVAKSTVITIPNVDSANERGLASVAFDPAFNTNGYFYVYYTHIGTTTNNRVSRFTFNGATAAAASEVLIWENPEATSSCCHYGGGLDFGPDGMLYLATGEEFDGLQSADLTRAGGKVIRLNTQGVIAGGPWVPGAANTHIIPTDNPAFIMDGPGGNLDEIWAYGLRNPYRMHWDLVEEVLYIGEVGGNIQSTATEDIHVGRAGAHFGWPNCEGFCNDDDYDDPIFSYPHNGSGAALTAGVVYRGGVFPASYDNVFFYGDYVRGEISYLTFDAAGAVSGSTLFGSGAGIGPVVALEAGSDGALYTVDYIGGTVKRIIYDSGNQRPVITSAQATSATSGAAPLSVGFTATATDAEMDPLTYTWEFGDGTTANGASVTHVYTSTGNFSAFVRVTDGQESVSAPIDIEVGAPPSVNITQPVNLALFRAGDSLAYQATGSDPDGTLQASSYSWNIEFTHNAHTHPALSSVGQSGTLTIGNSGHSYNDDTGYRLTVTVTDSDGLTATDFVEVKPEKVDISLSTVPAGIDIFLDGLPLETPVSYDTLIDFQHTVSVPDTACVNGTSYQFSSWSDGGARTHLYTVPNSNQPLQAVFSATGPCAGIPTGGLVGHYAADDGVLVNGIGVLAWEDLSDEGNDLQVSSGNTTIEYNAVNGLPAIDFDGNVDYLAKLGGVSGLPSGASDRSVYIVANYRSKVNGGIVFGRPINNQSFGLTTGNTGGGNLQIFGYGVANNIASTQPGNGQGWLIQSAIVQSNAYSHFLNGSLIDNGTKAFNTIPEDIVVGANIDLSDEANLQVAEILIYSRALSNMERQNVDAYLQNKYFSGASNTAPLANDDSASTSIGNSINISVLSNDNDSDGMLIANSVQLVTPAGNGSVLVNTDGTVTYTHNGSAIPFDSFQYTVADDDGASSNVATVSIVISGGSGGGLPQTGLVGHYESDQGVSVSGSNVISWQDQSSSANHLNVAIGDPQLVQNASENGLHPAVDFDGAGDLLTRTAGLTSFPISSANRTVFLVASYESVGAGGFGYGNAALNQAFGLSVNASGLLRVNAFGSAFDKNSATAGTNAGWLVQSAIVSSNQLVHFVDGVQIDSATRAYNTQSGNLVLGADIDQNPSVDMQVAALLVYNRALNAAELQDVQVYLQNKYFAPSSGNNPPNAVNDSGSVGTAGSTVLTVLGNDTDIDGTLVVGSVLASTPANGTAVVNANGTITYTHNGSATTGDSFTYTVEDDDGAVSNMATVSISITGGGNQIPVAANDAAGTTVGGSLAVNVLGNDNDPDGTLVLSSVAVVTGASNGTAVANANGTITYTHNGGASTSDTFQYTVQDDQGATSNTATVTMTIGGGGGPNQAPIANNDNATVAPGGTTSSQPLPTLVDSGSQTSGSSVTVTDTVDTAIGDRLVFAINTGGSKLTTANGSGWAEIVNDFADGSNAHPRLKVFEKVATAADVGGGVTHSFTISDGGHRASWALVRVKSFDPAVPTSVVSSDGGNTNLASYTSPALTGVAEDALLIDFVAAATDNLFPWSPLPNTPLATLYSTTQAFLAHNLASSFKYQAAAGTATGDTYSANDNARYVAAKLGFAPLSMGGTGNTVTIFILSNDSDSDGTLDPSSVTITSGASNGTTVVNGDGSITYTHDGGGSTSDSFQYTVDDDDGATSNVATVNITIGTGANQAPVANADSGTATVGGSVSLAVLSNDTDADGTLVATSVTITTAAGNGTAVANPDGTITYTHDGGGSISDTFQYIVSDDLGAISNAATVTVTISSGNLAPVAVDDSAGTGVGGTVAVTVLGNDTDTDGSLDVTSVAVTTAASNGTAVVNANGTISYTHDGGVSSSDVFQYTVNDDQGLTSNVATVTITITVPGVLPSAGLVGHYEADTLVTSGVGGVVSAWGDQSVSGNDLAGGGDPTLILNALNGNPVIDFDGAGDVLQDLAVTGLPTGASDRTMYMVASYETAGFGGAVFGLGTPNRAFGLTQNNLGNLTVQGWGSANDAVSSTGGVGAGWLVQSAVVSSSTVMHYSNGGLIDTQTRTYNTALDRIVFGEEISGLQSVDMQIAAVIIYDRALTPSEQQNVQNYLQAKYFGSGNIAPAANDDSDTVPVGSSVMSSVLTNDTDVDGSLVPTSVTITTAAVNGTAVANSDGTVTYTHDGSGATSDTYQYTVEDDDGAVSNAATVTISVTGINQSPTAVNDADTVATGDMVTTAVLTNDSDPDGTLLPTSVVITTAAVNGTAVPNTDGTITYTHDGGMSTSDTFQYTVNDDQGATSNVATVTIAVTGMLPTSGLVGHYEADALVAADAGNIVSAWGDQSVSGNDLVGGGDPTLILNALNGNPVIDFDGAGDVLQDLAVTGLPTGASDRTMYMVASYETAGFGGSAFGLGAPNQAFGLTQNNLGNLTVQGWGSANDAVSSTGGVGAGWLVQSAVVSSSTVMHYSNGGLIDTQTRTYNTALDRIVFGAEISGSQSVDMQIAAVIIYDRALTPSEQQTVQNYLQAKYFNGANQPPVASNDTDTTTIGGTVTTAILGNDTDSDGGVMATSVVITAQPANGTAVANTDGTVTYTHDGGVSTSDSYQYTVDDDQGATSNVATVTLTITGGGNQSPTATDDTDSTTTGGTVMTTVLGNDSDPDGTLVANTVVVTSGAANGTATANSDGTITYVHDGGSSTSDSYQYTVDDDQGATSNVATVTLTITGGGNQSPTATDDTDSTTTGGTVMTTVLGNDSDPDGTLVANTVVVTSGAANGTATANSDGTITYVHDGGSSTSDSYQYTVDDDQGATSNVATVTLTITGGSGVPVSSGLVGHYESDQGVQTAGVNVTTWEDQSGNANHLDVISGDPSVAAAGAPNGVLPAIDFDGAGDALSRATLTSFPTGASDRTVFMVASYESVGSGGFNYGLTASNQAFGLSVTSTGVLRVNAFGGAFDKVSSTVGTNAGWMVQSALVDTNQLTHFVDGVQIDSAARTYNTASGSLVIGADLDQSPNVDMQIAAILVYDRALSTGERAQIESYLQNKYF